MEVTEASEGWLEQAIERSSKIGAVDLTRAQIAVGIAQTLELRGIRESLDEIGRLLRSR